MIRSARDAVRVTRDLALHGSDAHLVASRLWTVLLVIESCLPGKSVPDSAALIRVQQASLQKISRESRRPRGLKAGLSFRFETA